MQKAHSSLPHCYVYLNDVIVSVFSMFFLQFATVQLRTFVMSCLSVYRLALPWDELLLRQNKDSYRCGEKAVISVPNLGYRCFHLPLV
jgi:hypothetical protein